MAELATIARPYAEALFRIAKPDGLDVWSDLLSEMAQIASVPELKELAHNPRADDAMVAETFLSAMKTALNAEAKNFVSTLVENNRLPLLPEIAAQFPTKFRDKYTIHLKQHKEVCRDHSKVPNHVRMPPMPDFVT